LQDEIITVRSGKGDQDRFVPLAHVAVESLRAHLVEGLRLYDADRRAGVAGVWLPDGLTGLIYTHVMRRPGLGVRSPLDA
jgi:hypothetical protein